MPRFFSPAKINLLLAIHQKLDDGFHELSSIVVACDFGDYITIEPSSAQSDSIDCTDPSVPCDSSNLIAKAMHCLRKEIDLPHVYHFHLEKNIPSGAGYGGGSSNAITALKAVLSLSNRNLEPSVLARIAAEIGSDCSFFLNPVPSFMRGRGERIEALPTHLAESILGTEIVLYKPNFSIATAQAYQQLHPKAYKTENETDQSIADFAESIDFSKLLYNSFSQQHEEKYMALYVLLSELRAAGIPSLISGSGSGCFSLLVGENINNQQTFIKDCIEHSLGKQAFFKQTQISSGLINLGSSDVPIDQPK